MTEKENLEKTSYIPAEHINPRRLTQAEVCDFSEKSVQSYTSHDKLESNHRLHFDEDNKQKKIEEVSNDHMSKVEANERVFSNSCEQMKGSVTEERLNTYPKDQSDIEGEKYINNSLEDAQQQINQNMSNLSKNMEVIGKTFQTKQSCTIEKIANSDKQTLVESQLSNKHSHNNKDNISEVNSIHCDFNNASKPRTSSFEKNAFATVNPFYLEEGNNVNYSSEISAYEIDVRYDSIQGYNNLPNAFSNQNHSQYPIADGYGGMDPQYHEAQLQQISYDQDQSYLYGNVQQPKVPREMKRKAKQRTCSNCSTTSTPSWRRGTNGKVLLCNACGLYLKLHGRSRPFSITSEGKTKALKGTFDKSTCIVCNTVTPVNELSNAPSGSTCISCMNYYSNEVVGSDSRFAYSSQEYSQSEYSHPDQYYSHPDYYSQYGYSQDEQYSPYYSSQSVQNGANYSYYPYENSYEIQSMNSNGGMPSQYYGYPPGSYVQNDEYYNYYNQHGLEYNSQHPLENNNSPQMQGQDIEEIKKMEKRSEREL